RRAAVAEGSAPAPRTYRPARPGPALRRARGSASCAAVRGLIYFFDPARFLFFAAGFFLFTGFVFFAGAFFPAAFGAAARRVGLALRGLLFFDDGFGELTANAAPWRSRPATIQLPSGTSIGPLMIWPPSFLIVAAAFFASATFI